MGVLRKYNTLIKVSDIGKGFEYKSNDNGISLTRKKGFVKGYASLDKNLLLTDLPKESWLSTDPDLVRRPGRGLNAKNHSQLLLNYARVGSGPWRLKCFVDKEGHSFTTSFMSIRPFNGWPLEMFWALLNSPFSNAYAYCNSMERTNQKDMISKLPVPQIDKGNINTITSLVKKYFELYSDEAFFQNNQKKAYKLILSIDAEILRLYDLPPKYEKKILDLFQGIQRKGVEFDFKGYYPEDFKSYIPLHVYISEEYQRSAPEFVSQWVEKNSSEDICEILKSATEAFEGD